MTLIYRGGRPYLYRSVRRSGRVTSEYVACGETALLIDAIRTIDRVERDGERDRLREQERLRDEHEQRLADLVDLSRELSRDALERAGYHQHKRQWRKRRMTPAARTMFGKDAGGLSEHRLLELHRKLDAMVAESLIGRLCGTNEAGAKARRTLEGEIEAHAAELAGPDPAPVERALAVTAAISHAELRAAEALEHLQSERSFAAIECDRRRIDRAHRRYLATLRTLAQVRRLAVPALQVNVARQQQINNGAP